MAIQSFKMQPWRQQKESLPKHTDWCFLLPRTCRMVFCLHLFHFWKPQQNIPPMSSENLCLHRWKGDKTKRDLPWPFYMFFWRFCFVVVFFLKSFKGIGTKNGAGMIVKILRISNFLLASFFLTDILKKQKLLPFSFRSWAIQDLIV